MSQVCHSFSLTTTFFGISSSKDLLFLLFSKSVSQSNKHQKLTTQKKCFHAVFFSANFPSSMAIPVDKKVIYILSRFRSQATLLLSLDSFLPNFSAYTIASPLKVLQSCFPFATHFSHFSSLFFYSYSFKLQKKMGTVQTKQKAKSTHQNKKMGSSFSFFSVLKKQNCCFCKARLNGKIDLEKNRWIWTTRIQQLDCIFFY